MTQQASTQHAVSQPAQRTCANAPLATVRHCGRSPRSGYKWRAPPHFTRFGFYSSASASASFLRVAAASAAASISNFFSAAS